MAIPVHLQNLDPIYLDSTLIIYDNTFYDALAKICSRDTTLTESNAQSSYFIVYTFPSYKAVLILDQALRERVLLVREILADLVADLSTVQYNKIKGLVFNNMFGI